MGRSTFCGGLGVFGFGFDVFPPLPTIPSEMKRIAWAPGKIEIVIFGILNLENRGN